ncbi:MAG: hypothetical protein IB618_00270 [Candidatus Pacearchaeota archaeon]|nr:MAG: hypothetical protein IB618_00270 [Candidatus Pacearchaeota archaeon]
MNINKEEECEECGYRGVLVSAVIDGKLKKICQRCVIANPVILIKKPLDVREEDIPRRSVHEILEEMSGFKPKPLEKPSSKVTLEDLRKRYEKVKERRRLLKEKEEKEKAETEVEEKKEKEKVLDEKEFIKHLEKEEKGEPAEKKEETIDFNIETTKHTRIRDLLERMKRTDKEIEKVEEKPAEEKEEVGEEVMKEIREEEKI